MPVGKGIGGVSCGRGVGGTSVAASVGTRGACGAVVGSGEAGGKVGSDGRVGMVNGATVGAALGAQAVALRIRAAMSKARPSGFMGFSYATQICLATSALCHTVCLMSRAEH